MPTDDAQQTVLRKLVLHDEQDSACSIHKVLVSHAPPSEKTSSSPNSSSCTFATEPRATYRVYLSNRVGAPPHVVFDTDEYARLKRRVAHLEACVERLTQRVRDHYFEDRCLPRPCTEVCIGEGDEEEAVVQLPEALPEIHDVLATTRSNSLRHPPTLVPPPLPRLEYTRVASSGYAPPVPPPRPTS